MYPQQPNNFGNNFNGYPGYNQPPIATKPQFGLALASGITGLAGIVFSLFLFSLMVSGTSGDTIFAQDSQGISLFIGLLLIVVGAVLALLGIISNKCRTVCIIILVVLGFPTAIALFLLTVLMFTFLGIG